MGREDIYIPWFEYGIGTGIDRAGAIIAADDFDNNYLRISDYTGLQLFEGPIIHHYEPDELKRYVANTEMHRISHYSKIYSVGYEEVVVMNGS